jgi:acetylornithine/succinyldiaminopimelate/putrescine aminotransferase
VVAAVLAQMGRLAHTSNLYYTTPQLEVAEELAQLGFVGRVFFANSGAEANEGAIKLCRKAAWRRAQVAGTPPPVEIVSFSHSFHGRTYGALAVTRGYQEGFGPMLPGFRELPWDDAAAAAEAIGPGVAGVIVEPVQGEGGVRPASPAFLAQLRASCDRHGACLIFDEIQCGLGRAGEHYAFQHFGVEPDVITLGKALGAGLPMGAVLARGSWGEALRPSDHATTFGGNPVVAAAAAAGLRVLREEGLAARSREMGAHLRRQLQSALAALPLVAEVRGLGLMCGVELTAPAPLAARVVDGCRQRGLLLNATAGNVVRIMPPLNVGAAEIDEAVEIVAAALAAEASTA